jgi:xanthine dehydrogenase YagS FAD-binding subunit
MKDHVVTPDYVVNLKSIPGLDYIKEERGGFRIGALAKLAEIEEHLAIKEKLLILSDAAGEAASPQIRNAGTLAGNICQRPFCWYFRSSNFTCLRKGGQLCYTVTGDGRFHAILGGGPSYIVHPSDTAPALVALGAQIKIVGPASERVTLLEKFFVLPSVDFKQENVLTSSEIVTEVTFPIPSPAAKAITTKSASD